MLKKFFSLLTLSMLAACATPGPTKEELDDAEMLVSLIEGQGKCDANLTLNKYDDELLIKLLGAEIIKNGIPRANSTKQAEFYRIALESKTIPRGSDKEKLIQGFTSSENRQCQEAMFSFNSKAIREELARTYAGQLKIADDIRAEKLSYDQIIKQAPQPNIQVWTQSLLPALKADPGLVNRFKYALSPITDRIMSIFNKYDIDSKSFK